MTIARTISALLVTVVLMAALAGCGGKEDKHDTRLDSIKAGATAQVTIERLRKQKDVNWNEVEKEYTVLLPTVKAIDAAHGTHYEKEISDCFAKLKKGEDVGVNMQTLAKGLQHVICIAIDDELAHLSSDPAAADRIAAYFEGIRPTFTRRDKDYYNSRKTLEAAAENAIATLVKEGKDASLAAKRELTDAIHRTYALCTLYEVQGIEKHHATDAAGAAKKRAEAIYFYRVIEPRVKKNSPAADQAIQNMLAASFDAMNAAELEKLLNKGLNGLTLR